jgi:hypothetical protein
VEILFNKSSPWVFPKLVCHCWEKSSIHAVFISTSRLSLERNSSSSALRIHLHGHSAHTTCFPNLRMPSALFQDVHGACMDRPAWRGTRPFLRWRGGEGGSSKERKCHAPTQISSDNVHAQRVLDGAMLCSGRLSLEARKCGLQVINKETQKQKGYAITRIVVDAGIEAAQQPIRLLVPVVAGIFSLRTVSLALQVSPASPPTPLPPLPAPSGFKNRYPSLDEE